MSSAVVSTSAAQGRPFLFDAELPAGVCSPTAAPKKPQLLSEIYPGGITPASQLKIRPAPQMASSGIASLDALTGGLPLGCLTEIFGPASSGRTSILLAALSAATRIGQFSVLVDAGNSFDPQSAASAAVDLDKLLWVRCGEDSPQKRKKTSDSRPQGRNGKTRHPAEERIEQLLRATDFLLESGGFGLIALDLADLPLQSVRRIPLTTWFRFRRAVEHKPTVLLVLEQQPIAGSCSSLLLKLSRQASPFSDATPSAKPAHAQLLTELEIDIEVVRLRLGSQNSDCGLPEAPRKPVSSASTTFTSATAWR